MPTPSLSTVVMFALALAACARPIEGLYVDAQGMTAFRLMNGKYYGTSIAADEARAARMPGQDAMPIALPYKVDGARLIVEKRGGNTFLEILPDGTLRRPGTPVRYVRREAGNAAPLAEARVASYNVGLSTNKP